MSDLLSLDEAAKLTGLKRLDIARLIHARKLDVTKLNGRNYVERSALNGINGYGQPKPKPASAPPPPPPREPEHDLWWPHYIYDIVPLASLDDAAQAQAIAEIERKHPHMRGYFEKYPLPRIFKPKVSPQAEPAKPPPREPEPAPSWQSGYTPAEPPPHEPDDFLWWDDEPGWHERDPLFAVSLSFNTSWSDGFKPRFGPQKRG